jgi:hypothetical protein
MVVDVVPENRVTTASPGRSGCCAIDGLVVSTKTAMKMLGSIARSHGICTPARRDHIIALPFSNRRTTTQPVAEQKH